MARHIHPVADEDASTAVAQLLPRHNSGVEEVFRFELTMWKASPLMRLPPPAR